MLAASVLDGEVVTEMLALLGLDGENMGWDGQDTFTSCLIIAISITFLAKLLYTNFTHVVGMAFCTCERHMNDKRSHFSVMNDIVNSKKDHNIVNDNSFATRNTAYL